MGKPCVSFGGGLWGVPPDRVMMAGLAGERHHSERSHILCGTEAHTGGLLGPCGAGLLLAAAVPGPRGAAAPRP